MQSLKESLYNVFILLIFIVRTVYMVGPKAKVCNRQNYREIINSWLPVHICDLNCKQNFSESRLSKNNLHTSLSDWKFAVPQLLLEFPIDKETKNYVREVKNALFSKVNPTPFQTQIEIVSYSSYVLKDMLDLDPSIINQKTFQLLVSGNGLLRGSTPVAHRYGGHQFGYWADQLGDGRAHILGEYVNNKGERWELQLKGSGKTPYSRQGDGRAVIRSSVREFLCSEAMYYLGIPTSRAATLVVSNDYVWRDQFYDGNPIKEKIAVVLRLAKSWFRFGSFEILKEKQEINLLKKLADFVIRNYFSDINLKEPNKYLIFYSKIVEETAHMIALWQSFGFAHGVCNTDNFSILSITIDYGPFGFMDNYNPKLVPNTSDDEGRYSFENQPDVGRYNLDKLRIALNPLLNNEQQITIKQILSGYNDFYKSKFLSIMKSKLGIFDHSNEETHEKLIVLLLKIMHESKADYTMTFRQLGYWSFNDMQIGHVEESLWSLKQIQKHSSFRKWTTYYSESLRISDTTKDLKRRKHMNSINPRYILRNWIAERVINLVEKGDYSLLKTVQNILKHPFTKQKAAETLGYGDPTPNWASHIRVSCSS